MSDTQTSDLLFEFLLQMGDNVLILGQRVSELCGHGPELEEDIAMANIGLDLIGHAQYWLDLAAEIEGKGRSSDDLSGHRDSYDFKNILLVEQPNHNYGHALMRNFLFDGFYLLLLKELSQSKHSRIAEIAQKVIKEVLYHYDRSSSLIIRLGDGTDESNQYMQEALDALWPYTGEMFQDLDSDSKLAEKSYAPLPSALRSAWLSNVEEILSEATLNIPKSQSFHYGGKQGRHSEYLGHMLTDLQWLQRAYPDARW